MRHAEALCLALNGIKIQFIGKSAAQSGVGCLQSGHFQGD